MLKKKPKEGEAPEEKPEPSFTQAIKERLAGEDVLSPDGSKGVKSAKRMWLSDILQSRK